MTVRYSAKAEEEIAELLAYLMERSPAAAKRLLSRLEAVIGALDEQRYAGMTVKLTSGEVVQSWPLYPYRVYYQRRGSTLDVLRIYHQARRPIVKRRKPR